MSRRPGRGRGPEQQGAEPQGGGQAGVPRGQRPQGGTAGAAASQGQGPGKSGPGWGPVRDSIRRDVEVAQSALAFAERLHEGLDGQRRLFIDFPRVMEEMRTGALERLAGALERIYDGGNGAFELSRFLRDLPLALGHLAAAEASARRNAAVARGPTNGAVARPAEPVETTTGSAPIAEVAGAVAEKDDPAELAGAAPSDAPAAAAAAEPPSSPAEPAGTPAAPPVEPAVAAAEAPPAPPAEPLSPRVELRSRLLTAAPQLAKAAQTFKRNASTVRRAAVPRRQPGPWRADKDVLEQAHRAVEFAAKAYDTYAEAWNDAPLPRNLVAQASAEMDRFLAWTQLARYTEVARAGSPQLPSGPKTHEAAPGVKAHGEARAAPAEAKAEAAPAEAKAEAAPAEAKAETAPVEAKAEAAPVEAKAETAPVEAKAETAPVEAKAETAPVEAKAEPTQDAPAPGEPAAVAGSDPATQGG